MHDLLRIASAMTVLHAGCAGPAPANPAAASTPSPPPAARPDPTMSARGVCVEPDMAPVRGEPTTPVGTASAVPGAEIAWAVSYGGDGADEAVQVALGPDGDLIVVGHVEGGAEVAGRRIAGAGGSDVIVLRFTRAGELRWARTLGGAGDDFGAGIAVDSAGNAVVLGSFGAAFRAGDVELAPRGEHDLFLASLDAAGAVRWATSFGSSAWEIADALAVDVDDDVVVAGAFSGALRAGELRATAAGDSDGFAVRFDPRGRAETVLRLGGAGWDQAVDADFDGEGNLVVAGDFEATADLAGRRVTSRGKRDGFLVVADDRGEARWARAFGGADDDRATAVAAGGDRIAVGGGFSRRADFGAGPVTASGAVDLFVATYDATGEHLWSQAFGGGGVDCAGAVELTEGGDVVLAGVFSGDVDFGGGVLRGGAADLVFAGLDTRGEHAWSFALGAPGASVRSLAVAGERVVAAGAFPSLVATGGGEGLRSRGGFDGFVVAVRPAPATGW